MLICFAVLNHQRFNRSLRHSLHLLQPKSRNSTHLLLVGAYEEQSVFERGAWQNLQIPALGNRQTQWMARRKNGNKHASCAIFPCCVTHSGSLMPRPRVLWARLRDVTILTGDWGGR